MIEYYPDRFDMDGNRPFGDFLRSRRARLSPDGSGSATRHRRRTPGLKREEVAQRAGISAEWYVKLEQGRAVSPSAETVEALGRALRLDGVELAHLRALAAAGGRQPFRRETVPDTLRHLVESLPGPAYLTGQRWDILAWNGASAALFGDFGQLEPENRNILHWMLTDASARSLFGITWPREAQRMVSLFRAAHDLWPGDVAFADLVNRLRAECPEFESWWAAHGIGAPISGTKQLHHPRLGTLIYDHASFQANDDPALKLALYICK
jgi:transcriptional regulator with XRE-family HTH domain